MVIKSILDWEIQSYANRKNIWNSEKYSFGKIKFFMGIRVNSSIFDSIVLSKLSVDFERLDFKVGPKPDKRGENDINLDTDYHVSSS